VCVCGVAVITIARTDFHGRWYHRVHSVNISAIIQLLCMHSYCCMLVSGWAVRLAASLPAAVAD
jgi:hypothetical protein